MIPNNIIFHPNFFGQPLVVVGFHQVSRDINLRAYAMYF